MASSPQIWPRRYYVPGGRNPFLFYVVYGHVDTTKSLSRGTYQSNGIPAVIEVMGFGPTIHPSQVTKKTVGFALVWARCPRS